MPLNKHAAGELLSSGLWNDLKEEAVKLAFKDWKKGVKGGTGLPEVKALITFDSYIELALRKAASKKTKGDED